MDLIQPKIVHEQKFVVRRNRHAMRVRPILLRLRTTPLVLEERHRIAQLAGLVHGKRCRASSAVVRGKGAAASVIEAHMTRTRPTRRNLADLRQLHGLAVNRKARDRAALFALKLIGLIC